SATVVRSAPPSTSRNTPMAIAAAVAMARAAIQPVAPFSHLRPKRPLIRNAASGSAGMSQTFAINDSSLHRVDLVHVHGRAVAVRGEHDREPDGDLGRRDDEDE